MASTGSIKAWLSRRRAFGRTAASLRATVYLPTPGKPLRKRMQGGEVVERVVSGVIVILGAVGADMGAGVGQ